MKVSVIIPAYNEEKYIAACLNSLMSQVEPADEIIVIDNNSTDKTCEVVSRYPVRLVKEKKQGITYSRNRGFNSATFEIIARTDADTRVPTTWIQKIKEDFKNEHVVGVSGPTSFYEPHASKKFDTFHKKAFFSSLKTLLGHNVLFGPNMAIRKSAWEKIKDSVCNADDEVHEDMDLSLHLAPYGKIIFDASLSASTSARRFKQFTPFVEYPYRFVRTLAIHQEPARSLGKKSIRGTSKLIKKIMANPNMQKLR